MKTTTVSGEFDSRTLRAMEIAAGALVIGLFVVTAAVAGGPLAAGARITNAAIGVMVALSTTTCGGMIGFLFGLRRASGNTDAPSGSSPGAGTSALQYNTSLEQVVDWLTKILIGAGLTQITTIKASLVNLSKAIGACVPLTQGDSTWVFWLTVLSYFGAVGFQAGYLATRLVLNRMLVVEESHLGKLTESTALMLTAKGIVRQVEESRSAALPEVTFAADAAESWKPVAPVTDPEDPQKGRFGGNPVSSDKRLQLSATVQPLGGPDGELFMISLRVESLYPEIPLQDPVKFFIHHSFTPDTAVIVPKVGSVSCVLELVAWGAFTVGAITNGGKTMMELDLATLQTAPAKFRER